MKKIVFKSVDFDYEIFGKGEIDYKAQIEGLLLTAGDPQAGTKPDEMREVIPIYMKVMAATDYVLLEDAEHKIVSDRFENAVFKFNCPEINAMIDDIQNAEEVKLKEVESG